jgi:hypothetical protein
MKTPTGLPLIASLNQLTRPSLIKCVQLGRPPSSTCHSHLTCVLLAIQRPLLMTWSPPTHMARPVSRIGHPGHDDKTANTLAVRRAEPLHAPALTAKARRPVPRLLGSVA